MIQQYLRLDIVDELEIALVPVLFGGGWLFKNLNEPPPQFPIYRVVESQAATFLCYVRELYCLESSTVSPPPATPPPLPEPLRLTLMAGVLTNEAEVAFRANGYDATGDPTEVALLLSAAAFGLAPEILRQTWSVEAEIPFEPVQQYSAALRRNGAERMLFVKGAPERLLEHCTRMLTANGEAPIAREEVLAQAHRLAAEGLRVLAMAIRRFTDAASIKPELEDLTFVGLQAMWDPPRAGVRQAIQGCHRAGIRVIMVTGDHAGTAAAIARELGIGGSTPRVITGAELAAMSDEELERAITETDVFARVAPEQKLRIVQALRRHGHTVAVTGDGVNDAPALRAADIGVAMEWGAAAPMWHAKPPTSCSRTITSSPSSKPSAKGA